MTLKHVNIDAIFGRLFCDTNIDCMFDIPFSVSSSSILIVAANIEDFMSRARKRTVL